MRRELYGGCGLSDTDVQTGAVITANEFHNNWSNFKATVISF